MSGPGCAIGRPAQARRKPAHQLALQHPVQERCSPAARALPRSLQGLAATPGCTLMAPYRRAQTLRAPQGTVTAWPHHAWPYLHLVCCKAWNNFRSGCLVSRCHRSIPGNSGALHISGSSWKLWGKPGGWYKLSWWAPRMDISVEKQAEARRSSNDSTAPWNSRRTMPSGQEAHLHGTAGRCQCRHSGDDRPHVLLPTVHEPGVYAVLL